MIYHAAAYKHVPIVEQNAVCGLRNNTFGTAALAECAKAAGVELVVLISTDKAVRPTNIMGASKRLAELVLQAAAANGGSTIFTMVRFGNVLDSSGSVVKKFRRQILAGGPVTVTHPEIIRYFMSIPEAAELVIQAGAMAEGGDVFVLDMGEPVRIDDLARLMVRLSGFDVRTADNPEGDIAIAYTGLRSGEKLYEELLIGANTKATEHPRIWRSDEPFLPSEELERELEILTGGDERARPRGDAGRAHAQRRGLSGEARDADERGKPARGLDAAIPDAALTWPMPAAAPAAGVATRRLRLPARCAAAAAARHARSARSWLAQPSRPRRGARVQRRRRARAGRAWRRARRSTRRTNGLKLFADWKAIGGLKQALTDWVAAAVVVAYGAKTMVYGALAAKSAGAERIVLVVDALPEHRFSGALAADEMPAWRYGQALRAADEAVFHNRDDLALLKKLALVPEALPVADRSGRRRRHREPVGAAAAGARPGARIPDDCQPREAPWRPRILRGGDGSCAGARRPRDSYLPACRPRVLPLRSLRRAGAAFADVEYLGAAADHPDALEQCHVFVYPSCAEGMPQPVLQAMAAGRPILTTNIAGCRDTVDERVNGCLVAPRDAEALAEAMESYLKRPDLIPAMARASRAKAERFGTAASVKRTMLELLRLEYACVNGWRKAGS